MNENIFYIYSALIILTAAVLLVVNRYLYYRELEEPEIFDAILNLEELEKHAAEIARRHVIDKRKRFHSSLESRMNRNFKYIGAVYKRLNEYAGATEQITPAAEWLLDNFYIIEEQVKEIRQNLSKQYYSQLPRLRNGWLRGYPRVYAIALELISHTDGRFDERTLISFITSYQHQALLSSGELWAIPLMVRMALIENIRNVCERIMQSQNQWYKAEKLAEALLAQKDKNPDDMYNLVYEHMKNEETVSPSFCEHLQNRLKKQGIEIAPIIYYLDERLSEQHTNGESITQLEHNEQARRQVSMGNAITSLRFISSLDWSEVFESLSQVEQILRQDPVQVYGAMDFQSRDYYRHAVEKLSKKYRVSEIQIARKSIELAEEADVHVGYFLVGKDRKELAARLGHNESMTFSKPSLYIGTILLLSAGILLVLAFLGAGSGRRSLGILLPALLLAVIPTLDIAVTIVNWFITHFVAAAFIPKMELREGIPQEAKTLVVIPTLLPNAPRAASLLEQLESYYLANREANLYFALLGDFKDTDAKEKPDDDAIVDTARDGIRRLNEAYGNQGDIFFFFHRERVYNEKQNKWMGWERKRGALVELNELLRQSEKTSINIIEGDLSQIKDIQYVITIDADTRLPIDAAKKLVGTILHPLNKAVVDEGSGIVKEGYGLLQPRINVDIVSANASPFARVFAGQGGIDIYTTAVSDVYQDTFGEGIFTGKGIYQLDAFRKLLHQAIPENTVLSHDLLEGSYLRTGLVTDIELIDGYPARYNASSMRLHRWVRGDWQVLPWLFGHVISRDGQRIKNPLNAVSRWKIFDNLRRSLSAPATFILLFTTLLLIPGSRLAWLVFILLDLFSSVIFAIINILVEKARTFFSYGHGKEQARPLVNPILNALQQTFFQIAFLPYQAWLMTDAIVKTIYRISVSKRNMLEWVTAADMESGLKNDLKSFQRRMWMCPAAGLVIFLLSIRMLTWVLPVSALIGIFWAFSPYLAYRISKVDSKTASTIEEDDKGLVRLFARKTWSFFEDYVGAIDNYLPPDNYQENPPNGIAHRTSPTNIGLLIVSILSARDLGYITSSEMLDKLDQTLTTIEKLKKWHGHLYNWYDTLTLEVLRPNYISTVDSGNLVGYLMTLKQGLLEYQKRPLLDKSLILGLRDTLVLAEENVEAGKETSALKSLDGFLKEESLDPEAWLQFLEQLEKGNPAGKSKWHYKLNRMIGSIIRECRTLSSIKSDGKPDHLQDRFHDLIARTGELVDAMKFSPLYDSRRKLFSIGYNEEEEQLTKSYYDLLASEARQASFIAIARGEVKKEHWFSLDRTLTSVSGYKGLVSWTGTMFEYLMPLLIMKNYENTLFNETYQFVIRCQKEYGRKREVPWGVSESGYFSFDFKLNYQYKAFGIPSLGLKRGLINDTVIAPYATMLALMVAPGDAIANLRELVKSGLDSDNGFYEAVDYTPERQTRNRKSSVVKSYMAHHQGMAFLAMNNVLHENILQTRFHRDPVIKSAELLLQEKIPSKVIFAKDYKEKIEPFKELLREETEYMTSFGLKEGPLPEVYILSNGNYSLLITDRGCGYSRFRDLTVTRWREDPIETRYGTFFYIRDLDSGTVWSAAYAPVWKQPDKYQVVFSQDKAVYLRSDESVDTQMEIIVSPEDDAEVRRITLTNHSQQIKTLEITSYLEVVLNHQSTDVVHPGFSNLFVRTDFLPKYNSLIAERKPREAKGEKIWAVHSVKLDEDSIGGIQYETDRARFIGRAQNHVNPLAVSANYPLSNSVGPVLDPVMSLRVRIRLQPGQTVKMNFMTGVAEKYEKALALAEKYQEHSAVERAFELAWTRSQVELRYLNLTREEIETYRQIMSHIVFLSPLRRKNSDILVKNRKGQNGLWAYGISGDVPIILLIINKSEEIGLVKEALKAHEYWRLKGLPVDLVIMNMDAGSYHQPLYNMIQDIVSISHARDLREQRGGVHIKQGTVMSEEDKVLLMTASRLVLYGHGGGMDAQVKMPDRLPILEKKHWTKKREIYEIREEHHEELLFYNGCGGFSQDGTEYVIRLTEAVNTPAPWINVISNRSFGFQVSELGSTYTWAENSRENKLSPWSNDPVADPSGEIIYIRDEDTGEYWSLTPYPIRGAGEYVIRHGFGYSSFQNTGHGLTQDLKMFVPLSDPVKLFQAHMKNNTTKTRHLSLFFFVRPVMGVSEQFSLPFIVTDFKGNNLFIKNTYNSDFPDRVAFVSASEKVYSYTGDRREFIGFMGHVSAPESLERERFSNVVGSGYDPCACIQVKMSIEPQGDSKMVFLYGQEKDQERAARLSQKYAALTAADKTFDEVRNYWKQLLGTVKVKTPDTSMDIMLNGWLLYQTISCRLFSRTAFYQSGGAYGFRDQLQDVMSLYHIKTAAIRDQILTHAAHQYPEGDVQHWWHPATDKGIRTRFSDDLLWLPYVTAEYLEVTEDWNLLQEKLPYLEEACLLNDEDERFGKPCITDYEETLYMHCIKAIEYSLKFGQHGLPLMGSGDWNDGMNTVGNQGKGESVWLAWFLYTILLKFAEVCRHEKDNQRADRYANIARELSKSIEENAWDGNWYRRAYFDNGIPLGSAENTECKIDSLAQSWGVISGASRPERNEAAFQSLDHYLVRKDEGLVLLLTPPFDEGDLEPGYIKSYLPGVRENGGQYTHAATWVVMAYAMMGQGDKAWELYHMLNPINHASTAMEMARYKVEPYVMAADVYAVYPHAGRGGWTWYTGASGWMYRVGLQNILGLNKKGSSLVIKPSIPKYWDNYEIEYHFGKTIYNINVRNPEQKSCGSVTIKLDKSSVEGDGIPLKDDGKKHHVEVILH